MLPRELSLVKRTSPITRAKLDMKRVEHNCGWALYKNLTIVIITVIYWCTVYLNYVPVYRYVLVYWCAVMYQRTVMYWYIHTVMYWYIVTY